MSGQTYQHILAAIDLGNDDDSFLYAGEVASSTATTPTVFIAGGSGNDSKVMGDPEYAPKNSVCSQSYLYSSFKTEIEAKNFIKYIKTRFFRIIVSAMKITQSAPSRVYKFVPLEKLDNESDIDWKKSLSEIDQQLYKKYGLTDNEIAFIESMIKPMD